jgi:hypothetical protein
MNKTIVSSLILLGCSLHAVESRIEIRHREAGGVGYNTGYSSLDYFLMTEGNAEFLLDLRGHVFNNGKGAGNAGFGVRYPIKDDKYLIGVNAFYDLRQSNHLFCHQVGAGLEWLGQYVDFRANGYLPVGTKKVKKTHETKTFDSFSGRNVYIQRKLKAALPSIDAEIGTPLPRPFYFAVGAYYLFKQTESSLKVGQALGGRFRAEVDIGRYFTLGFAITYDRIFKTRPQGYISLNIPFEKKSCKKKDPCAPYERNLRRVPIMRNEIIPVEHKKQSKDVITGTNNNAVTFLFVNNTASFPGDGSFESPFSTLIDAEMNSAPGDVIYVYAGDGTARNYDQGITLKDKQILASSGGELVVNDVVIPPQTPGSKPHITNINKTNLPELTVDDIIANRGNTHIDDFFWVPPWEYIFGKGLESDPFDFAKDEDFVIVQPERVPIDLGQVAIIDNYQPAPPAPTPGSTAVLHSPINVMDDY